MKDSLWDMSIDIWTVGSLIALLVADAWRVARSRPALSATVVVVAAVVWMMGKQR